jgi:hypothetical protein
MLNASWDTLMADSKAFGPGTELDIINSSCTYGPAQSGNWYAGVAAPSGNTDAFTMTLTVPLVSGMHYSMRFYDKADSTYSPGVPVVIGVSTVHDSIGTIIYTGPTPAVAVWNLRSFAFTAPCNGQYISVSTTGVPRWSHVDNFLMLYPENINEVSDNLKVDVYPNPFTSTTTINFSEEQKQTSIKITDILGHQVYNVVIPNGARSYTIDNCNWSNGIYFLQIQSEKGTVNRKIVKE